MGKKPFINKKKAATFTLVYRDSLNDGGGEDSVGDKVFTRIDGGTSHVPGFSQDDPWSQLPVEDRPSASLPPGRRAPQAYGADDDWDEYEGGEEGWEEDGDGPPSLSQLESELKFTGVEAPYGGATSSHDRLRNPVTDDTRQEILALGFPDDGYNYMQHLRQIGGRVGSAFIPAPRPKLSLRPDVQAFDARKASLAAAAKKEVEGEDLASVVPEEVFHGVKPIRPKGARTHGIDPDIAKALEESDGSECEDGDLLEDDFVLLANDEAGPSGEGAGSASEDDKDEPGWVCDVDESLATSAGMKGVAIGDVAAWGSDGEGEYGFGGKQQQRRGGGGNAAGGSEEVGIGRTWPKGTSSVGTRELERPVRLLDEQFENLALAEYGDEDEWGELDEDDPEAHGRRDIGDFSDILDRYLDEHKPHMNPHAYVSAAEEGRLAASNKPRESKDSKAENVPHSALESEQPMEGVRDVGLEGAEEENAEVASSEEEEQEEAVLVEVVEQDREQWDCESIVSTYSNLENHPARIGAPSKRKNQHQQLVPPQPVGGPVSGIIRLGGRDKLPVDFLPPRPTLAGKANPLPANERVPEINRDVKVTKKGGPRGGETPAERKARKGALKEERREARACKKAVKTLYQAEAKVAQQAVAHTSVQGIHLP